MLVRKVLLYHFPSLTSMHVQVRILAQIFTENLMKNVGPLHLHLITCLHIWVLLWFKFLSEVPSKESFTKCDFHWIHWPDILEGIEKLSVCTCQKYTSSMYKLFSAWSYFLFLKKTKTAIVNKFKQKVTKLPVKTGNKANFLYSSNYDHIQKDSQWQPKLM